MVKVGVDVIEDFPYPSEEVIQQITAAYSEGRIVDLPDPFGFATNPGMVVDLQLFMRRHPHAQDRRPNSVGLLSYEHLISSMIHSCVRHLHSSALIRTADAW